MLVGFEILFECAYHNLCWLLVYEVGEGVIYIENLRISKGIVTILQHITNFHILSFEVLYYVKLFYYPPNDKNIIYRKHVPYFIDIRIFDLRIYILICFFVC